MNVNFAAAASFLDFIAGSRGAAATFQTFADSKASQDADGLARILHGTLAQHGDALADLNGRGAGIFVMINAGDGAGRGNANVTAVRAFWLDTDGAPLDSILAALPLPPDALIESSAGKYHVYWRVTGCPKSEFGRIQKALAERFGTDPAVKDLARVMRVPGFVHQKPADDRDGAARHSGEPFLTRIVEIHPENLVHTYTGFCTALGLPLEAPAPQPRPVDPVRVADGSGTPYGRAALRSACDRIAGAAEGTRHTTLTAQAAGIAELVASGQLPAADAAEALVAAGVAAGLPESECRECVQWGEKKGAEHPRAPEARRTVVGGQAEAVHGRLAAQLDQLAVLVRRGDVAPAQARARLEALAREVRSPLSAALLAASQAPTDAEVEAAMLPWPHVWMSVSECGLLPRQEVTVIAAPSREGKTAVITLLLSYRSEGWAIGGMQPCTRNPRTIVFSAEDTRPQYLRKMRAACEAMQGDWEALKRNLIVPDLDRPELERLKTIVRQGNYGRPEVAAEIIDIICDGFQGLHPDVLVFETASTLSECDEDNVAFRMLVLALRTVAKRLDCAVLLSHHFSQIGIGKLPTLDLDVTCMRGGTALVCNDRQNLLFVNLGSDREPFDDCDAREVLRRYVATAVNDGGSVLMLVPIDTSKAANPDPMFFSWTKTRFGPALIPAKAREEIAGRSWKAVRKFIRGLMKQRATSGANAPRTEGQQHGRHARAA